jgi:predicted nucleic acid-binding protein
VKRVILDTGPLVAFMDRGEPFHAWSVAQLEQAAAPLLSCEAVIAETDYIIRSRGGDPAGLYEQIAEGVIDVSFSLAREIRPVAGLMRRFADQDMQLADACVVRLSELHEDCVVLTTDVRDFSVYRRFERQRIPFLAPRI